MDGPLKPTCHQSVTDCRRAAYTCCAALGGGSILSGGWEAHVPHGCLSIFHYLGVETCSFLDRPLGASLRLLVRAWHQRLMGLGGCSVLLRDERNGHLGQTLRRLLGSDGGPALRLY